MRRSGKGGGGPRRARWALGLGLGLFAGAALAVPPGELAARARAAEARREWAAGAAALEELVAAGVDGTDVLYDLGVLEAQGGRLGRAVWRFEQVVRRAPWRFAAQRNLRATRVRLARRDAARSGRAVVETSVGLVVQIGELLPYDVAVPLVVLAEALALAAWWWRRRTANELGRVAGAVVVSLAAATAVFGVGVVAARRASPPAGIVLGEAQRLLQTPRTDGIPDEPVREGERVDLLRREGEFVRVRTLAGRTGWIRTRAVGALGE